MRVLFLDIDGVLNSEVYFDDHEVKVTLDRSTALSPEWWAAAIDPKAVLLLNQIVTRTGAKVVASSSWRVGTTVEDVQAMLACRGFEGEIVGFTPRIYDVQRAQEIAAWLRQNQSLLDQPPRVVILDDDPEAEVAPYFVKTEYEAGLTRSHVERAVALLGEV